MADNLEFETVKARILIMSQYFPEYSDALNKSLNYAKEDPSAGLLKSRQVLEEVCKTIWSKYESTPPPSIFDIFNTESIKSKIPKRVLNRVHSLRNICNVGIHGDQVTPDDVLMSINHLFVLLDWYGMTHKSLDQLPEAVQPAHSFLRYIKDSTKDKLFLLIVLFNTFIPAILFRYHSQLPRELDRPFNKVYEGIFYKGVLFFNGLSFSILYSLMLVFITSSLSWIIFKRFRKQNLESRLLSFELMYILVFGAQFILLHILDYYTRAF